MPFSHHSHSGQFCPGHAADSLEDIIQTAIGKNLRVFALSEHMPRHEVDFYPEEKGTGDSLQRHFDNQAAYFAEACRLREKYKDRIEIPIGFEGDWIRPESQELIERSIKAHPFDFFIGSVHHVHTIPIDYDRAMYDAARRKAGGSDEQLFQDYFDAQFDMLQSVKPPVVGHFDLIRLKSANPDGSFRNMPGVWQRILRNLDLIASYGGVVEINTAALRKGMSEPYPKTEICQVGLERGIRFCLSDDSHGVSQVAYGFDEALQFLHKSQIESLVFAKHITHAASVMDSRFPTLQLIEVRVEDL